MDKTRLVLLPPECVEVAILQRNILQKLILATPKSFAVALHSLIWSRQSIDVLTSNSADDNNQQWEHDMMNFIH